MLNSILLFTPKHTFHCILFCRFLLKIAQTIKCQNLIFFSHFNTHYNACLFVYLKSQFNVDRFRQSNRDVHIHTSLNSLNHLVGIVIFICTFGVLLVGWVID